MPTLESRVDDLAKYVARIPDPSLSNYRMVLASWKKVMEELLTIVRDVVKHDAPPA